MKKFFLFFPVALIHIMAGILGGIILLSAVFLIPVEKIKANIISSEKVLISEGAYPDAYLWCQSELDNFTDAIMLSEAVCDTESVSTVQKAMLSNRYRVFEDWTGLYHFIDGRPIEKIESYARYWHGYLITLKPLLCLTDYSGIRTVNLIVQTVLVSAICLLLSKKGHKDYLFPYVISILIISPLVIAKSLQMSTCYYIFNAGCIAVLMEKDKKDFKKFMLLFLWLGIITAYFDFLTYPIATFGMPAVFYLICTDIDDCRKFLLRLLNLLFCWGAGYVVMWASKWFLAELITGVNVLANAAKEAEIWVDEAKKSYTLFYTFYRNIRSFVLNPAFVVAFASAIVFIVLDIKKHGIKCISNRENIFRMLPFIAIALLPFIWYSAMIAHSYVHDFFTSKALVVTAFSLLSMLKKLNV